MYQNVLEQLRENMNKKKEQEENLISSDPGIDTDKENRERGKRRLSRLNEHLSHSDKSFNDPENTPWLQKDPRLCITMRTWLPYLNSKPAVLHTYRHPLEVAMSLYKREEGFTITRGMRLWILYNKAAVQNSADLCRVTSNNNAVLADPLGETKRIAKELENNCDVPAPPNEITQNVVDGFVDTTLQHNKKVLDEKKKDKKVVATHGNCKVHDYDSQVDGPAKKREMEIYLMAMKVYCDLESGEAYHSDYEWPTF